MNFIKKLSGYTKGSRQIVPSPGLYHYEFKDEQEECRVHLRVDEDRAGFLMVNASRVVHLNASAAQMAFCVLEQYNQDKAIRLIRNQYRVSTEQAINDYTQVQHQIQELIRPDGACPLHDLELEIIPPFHTHPSAPYRMDLAITYRCNNDCAHCYNDRPRDYPELSTQQWKDIISAIWKYSIPHIVFTGGEPTLRPDLPELITYAEQTGLITGLNTNARRLSDPDYVKQLVDSGLDHVQVTLESHDPVIHDQMVRCQGAWQQTVAGIRNVLNSRLFVMTNTTMLTNNQTSLENTLDFLSELGVPTIGLNALIYAGHGKDVGTGLSETDLTPLLALARSKTEQNDQRLIWYTPTEYCQFDPMQLELGVKGCTAALYNMCIESDGSVIPCQSYYESLGNILSDPWDAIWNHDLAKALRQRTYVSSRCQGCILLQECGGGCPLHSQSTFPSNQSAKHQSLLGVNS